jgi:hypothetical protein
MFVDVISVSAVLYIINFANFYQNGPKKATFLMFLWKGTLLPNNNHLPFYPPLHSLSASQRCKLNGEYTRKIIGVSGKLRTIYNPFLL